ncbi:TIGR03086 family protein [Nocardioides psychrotolerans]|uniref:TIGR03086 family protein n=1 Tax=Nocardioides psychrotolerans TaxID=1005945 RepID=A0A1I3G8Q2_9ACTN|nr:maleylpyruvate isomerase family mycothiol-dependent enzyme [Nocardioides psychrotolerans]GEP39952.1 TIGR03086 family protein [Nocardioides psychrotolerans]SFI19915.1 TIGR03086 family protein [Nocardioides psychrotolerans]
MTGRLARLPGHDGAVELLDRSLAYTRVALAAVTDDRLSARTPCERWDLARLLAHMEDALDAFGEGATGTVRLTTTTPAAGRVRTLQQKACALVGAWSHEVPPSVTVGGRALDTSVLALTAALEITVHGWDVAWSVGLDHPVPDALADRLLPVARTLVTPSDRGTRFAAPTLPDLSCSASALLLGHLGRRMTGPPGQENVKPGAGPQIAS